MDKQYNVFTSTSTTSIYYNCVNTSEVVCEEVKCDDDDDDVLPASPQRTEPSGWSWSADRSGVLRECGT